MTKIPPRVRPDTLLTWSEPDADGDITAGHYIVTIPTKSVPAHRAHFCPVSRATMIKDGCDIESEALLRTGWEP